MLWLGEETYAFNQNTEAFEEDLDCIPRYVIKQCIPNGDDQNHVFRTSPWRMPEILRRQAEETAKAKKSQ
jgi:hypothetical protein